MSDIAGVYKWGPSEIGKLYLHDKDFAGLFWWDKQAKKYIEEIGKLGGK